MSALLLERVIFFGSGPIPQGRAGAGPDLRNLEDEFSNVESRSGRGGVRLNHNVFPTLSVAGV